MLKLGRMDIPPHAEQPIPGVAEWTNLQNGFHILAIHYTADPEKCTAAWKAKASVGYKQQDWDQEFELDFESWAGLPVYLQFAKNTHVSQTSLFPRYRQDLWMHRWWDIGIHACVWAQVQKGQLLLFASRQIAGAFGVRDARYEDHEFVCSGLGAFIQLCLDYSEEQFPGCQWRDVGDPCIWNNTITRQQRDKPITIFQDYGLGNIVPGTTQEYAARINFVDNWLQALAPGRRDPEPALLIDPSAKVLIDGFAGGYVRGKEGQREGGKAEPEKGPFSHCMDAIQYGCSILPPKPFSSHSKPEVAIEPTRTGYKPQRRRSSYDNDQDWQQW